ncbi:MAG TPA: Lar family restriction alleviation protein [Sphingobacteriaceae bacterium]
MKLEPCPFCGGTAKYDKLPDRMDGITYGYDTVIVCTKCHASTGRVRGGKEKQQKEFAAKAWNTRQSTLSERVAELENLLNTEIMPRYVELYEAQFGDVSDSVAVRLAKEVLEEKK